MARSSTYHKSVLFKEVLEALTVVPGEYYLDATLGGGGHTEGILDFGGRVIALDVDTDAIDYVSKRFGLGQENGVWVTQDRSLTILQKNFRELDKAVEVTGVKSFAGIIFDLGVSSFMLDQPSKGFSFSKEGPLDMRMDPALGVTAADLINALNEGELYELFTRFGQESGARRLARDIVRYRVEKPIKTTTQLSELINNSLGKTKKKGSINPSTKAFMALRIAVNDELGSLTQALEKAEKVLGQGGRLAVISFHSLEDKIVKDFFKNSSNLRILTKKPIVASDEEIELNPRARSAKLRVAEKIN